MLQLLPKPQMKRQEERSNQLKHALVAVCFLPVNTSALGCLSISNGACAWLCRRDSVHPCVSERVFVNMLFFFSVSKKEKRAVRIFLYWDYQVAMVSSCREVAPSLQGMMREGRRGEEKEGGETGCSIKIAMINCSHSSNAGPTQKNLHGLWMKSCIKRYGC